MIDDNSKEFIKRHIGPSEEDQSKMLQYVGYKSLEDLMSNTVPEKILLKDDLKIDQPMSAVSYTHLTLPTIRSV